MIEERKKTDEEYEFTPEQSEAIKAKGKVIVSASAGSGKTCIMVERILRLVTEGEASLLDVLAVTFTNKAAAQMKEKIREALLKEMKKTGADEGEKRARIKSELDLLGLAQFSTVHSFCGKIIRTYFYLLPEEGLSPDFRILSEEDAAGLKAKAYSAALENGFKKKDREYQAFKRVLDVHYNDSTRKDLRAIIMKMYEQVRGLEKSEGYLLRAGEQKFDEIAFAIGADYKRKLSAYRKEIEECYHKLTTHKAGATPTRDALISAIDFVLAHSSPFEMAKAPLEIPKMPNRPKKDPEEYYNLSVMMELNRGVKDLIGELTSTYVNEEWEREKYRGATEHAAALAALCLDYGREYARLKREANALDYEDLEHFALALLEKEEVRAEVQNNYCYVYVDEYQDVNPMQESIISKIVKDNVFLVGDEKQAIYCFRGSRSRYFRAKRQEFGKTYPLSENFRSASKILHTVNEIFEPVMEHYEKMVGGRKYDGNAGAILSHEIANPKARKPKSNQSAEEQSKRGVYSVRNAATAEKPCELGEAIVKVIKSEIGKEFYDLKQNGFRKVGYGDIAVLVRKDKTDGKRIAATLMEHKIPFTSSAKVDVCEYYEIKLLLDCLRFLDNADSDIPLAAVMLSQIGKFTEEDLMKIRLAYPAAPTFRVATRLYAHETDDAVEKDDELCQRLKAFYIKVKRLRAFAKVRSAAEVLDTLLTEGLEVQIAAGEDGANCLKRVRRLIAEAGSGGSVHDFLLHIKELNGGLKLTESGGENAVKVMTMHASKGLEFPVVILATLEDFLHSHNPKEVEWSENFLFAPRYYDVVNKTYSDTIARRATAIERAAEEEEGERNLLYVGMTRAMYRLHLMVADRERPLSSLSYSRLSDYFGERFRGDTIEAEIAQAPQEQEPEQDAVYERAETQEQENQVLGVMKIGADYPYLESVYLPQKSSATAMLKEQSQRVYSANALSASTTEEGTAYHKFLQHYRFGADVSEELMRMTRTKLLSQEEAQNLDLKQLERIAGIPCLKALAGKYCDREKKFLLSCTPKEAGRGQDEGVQIIYQGAIDLLFQDETGYVIYDYKYSGQDKKSLEEHYRPQIELYKDAVAKGKRVARSTIRAKIINIRCAEVIDM